MNPLFSASQQFSYTEVHTSPCRSVPTCVTLVSTRTLNRMHSDLDGSSRIDVDPASDLKLTSNFCAASEEADICVNKHHRLSHGCDDGLNRPKPVENWPNPDACSGTRQQSIFFLFHLTRWVDETARQIGVIRSKHRLEDAAVLTVAGFFGFREAIRALGMKERQQHEDDAAKDPAATLFQAVIGTERCHASRTKRSIANSGFPCTVLSVRTNEQSPSRLLDRRVTISRHPELHRTRSTLNVATADDR